MKKIKLKLAFFQMEGIFEVFSDLIDLTVKDNNVLYSAPDKLKLIEKLKVKYLEELEQKNKTELKQQKLFK